MGTYSMSNYAIVKQGKKIGNMKITRIEDEEGVVTEIESNEN